MKLVKYLFMGLILANSGWGLGMESGSDSDDGGVVESKLASEAGDVGGSANPVTGGVYANFDKLSEDGNSLIISYYGNIITVPKDVWSKFEWLKIRFGSDFGFKPEFEEEDLAHLYGLFKSLQSGTDLKLYDMDNLIALVYYADFFGLNDQELIEPILVQIRLKINIATFAKLELPEINIKLASKRFHMAKNIYWSPSGNKYWLKASDDQVQLYNANTGAVVPGSRLLNVKFIKWSARDDKFWLIFNDGRAQLYNHNVVPQKQQLRNVSDIHWSPKGDRYFVHFLNNETQLYNLEGKQLRDSTGDPLFSVVHYYWSPMGNWCWLVKNDGEAQLYNSNLVRQGAQLPGVTDVEWSPTGYICKIWYESPLDELQLLHLYHANGEPFSDPLLNVTNIEWSPSSNKYWMQLNDWQAQLYSSNGTTIGGQLVNVSSIKWSPKGDICLIKFFDDSVQLYNDNGVSIADRVSNVTSIEWSPQGTCFWLLFADKKAQLYNTDGVPQEGPLLNINSIEWAPKNGKYAVLFENGDINIDSIWSLGSQVMTFSQQLLLQAIFNDYKGKPVLLPTDLSSQLPAEIQENLIKGGYLDKND